MMQILRPDFDTSPTRVRSDFENRRVRMALKRLTLRHVSSGQSSDICNDGTDDIKADDDSSSDTSENSLKSNESCDLSSTSDMALRKSYTSAVASTPRPSTVTAYNQRRRRRRSERRVSALYDETRQTSEPDASDSGTSSVGSNSHGNGINTHRPISTAVATGDNLTTPLFLQLQCSLRVNGRMYSCIMHSLPSCVEELLRLVNYDGDRGDIY
jgi:hypothetical protein